MDINEISPNNSYIKNYNYYSIYNEILKESYKIIIDNFNNEDKKKEFSYYYNMKIIIEENN